jgi:hypothetical protein
MKLWELVEGFHLIKTATLQNIAVNLLKIQVIKPLIILCKILQGNPLCPKSVQLRQSQEGRAKMIDYKLLQTKCEKTAKDLTHLQNTLLSVQFPEILEAIALLEFVSKHEIKHES